MLLKYIKGFFEKYKVVSMIELLLTVGHDGPYIIWQKANVRCCPKEVLETNQMLKKNQRQYVLKKGFKNILSMQLDGVEGRSLLCWLLDHIDLESMTLRAGRGKELKFSKDVVRLVLGLPSAGSTPPTVFASEKSKQVLKFREVMNLESRAFDVETMQDRIRSGLDDDATMMCYFIVIFHSILFPHGSWDISNDDVMLAHWVVQMPKIDWCQLIYTDLCHSVEKWQKRKKDNQTATMYGCSIVFLVSTLIRNFSFICIIAFR